MNIKQLISPNPTKFRIFPENTPYLEVAEFFGPTIQGENFVGWPSVFLRLQHCTLNCTWCDTQEVWRYGNPYTFNELFEMMEKSDIIEVLKDGAHLILTGGSPLKQQDNLVLFINEFIEKYGFKPYIEVENETTLFPSKEFESIVDLWNNSPKLSNSGNPDILRYRPKVIKHISSLNNSWFKFVVNKEEDWDEIQRDFLDKELINKKQIVLMPEGASKEELEINRLVAVEIALKHNVRYTTREHVVLWNKSVSV